MYCKVHRPVNTPGVSDNKGKCVQLVEYLSKELKEERPYYDNFFSQKEDYVTPLTVMHHMDNNHRTLKRNDDRLIARFVPLFSKLKIYLIQLDKYLALLFGHRP